MSELPEHVARNRADWDAHADDWVEPGRRDWAREEPWWGIFTVPESQLHVLPDDLDGLDAIELGCGTGYVSAWLARRGARPGRDRQLRAPARHRPRAAGGVRDRLPARARQRRATPFEDASFDFAISEYGASIWCDPCKWIPEAARLLRAGGRLVFLVTTLSIMSVSHDASRRCRNAIASSFLPLKLRYSVIFATPARLGDRVDSRRPDARTAEQLRAPRSGAARGRCA